MSDDISGMTVPEAYELGRADGRAAAERERDEAMARLDVALKNQYPNSLIGLAVHNGDLKSALEQSMAENGRLRAVVDAAKIVMQGEHIAADEPIEGCKHRICKALAALEEK